MSKYVQWCMCRHRQKGNPAQDIKTHVIKGFSRVTKNVAYTISTKSLHNKAKITESISNMMQQGTDYNLSLYQIIVGPTKYSVNNIVTG